MKIRTTMITMTAVLGILALAPGAMANLVTVLNPSFESPDLNDGTTGNAPDNWTKFGRTDVAFHEGRNISYNYAGPTDGDQVLVLDDRSNWAPPGGGGAWQSLGTGASLKALGPTLVATFDARKGGNGDQNQFNRPDVGLFSYFTVGGVKDTTDDLFVTHEDGSALRKRSVIFADTGLNMDPFRISMPTAGMGDGDEVRLYFEAQWEMDGSSQTTGSRAFIDNVQVSVIPEPGTIALLGLAGLVMLIRRRFVK